MQVLNTGFWSHFRDTGAQPLDSNSHPERHKSPVGPISHLPALCRSQTHHKGPKNGTEHLCLGKLIPLPSTSKPTSQCHCLGLDVNTKTPHACVSISHVAPQGHWVQEPKYLSYSLSYIQKRIHPADAAMSCTWLEGNTKASFMLPLKPSHKMFCE